jgi:hypothetical protein
MALIVARKKAGTREFLRASTPFRIALIGAVVVYYAVCGSCLFSWMFKDIHLPQNPRAFKYREC